MASGCSGSYNFMKKRQIEQRCKFRKPTALQALELIDLFLCEWGCEDHVLKGKNMQACFMFAHIAIGECRAHHDWRQEFWKWYRHMKAEKKAMDSGKTDQWRALANKRPWRQDELGPDSGLQK